MTDSAETSASAPGAALRAGSHSLSDLSDRPFRRRRPLRRSNRLKRLLSPFTRLGLRLIRLGAAGLTKATDNRENRGGPRSRLLALVPGKGPQSGGSLALYAHYSPHSCISEMVLTQVRAYADLGFRVVFVSSSPRLEPADATALVESTALILHRRNFGLDFGTWSDALALRPDLLDGTEELLLVNDSVIGPLRPLSPLLARLRAAGEGLFGLTDSVQIAPHLQSYFLLARGPAAIDDVANFLRKQRLSADKRTVIRRFEIGLSEHMRDLGHRVASAWGYDELEDDVLRSETDTAALLAVLPGSRSFAGGPGGQFDLRRHLLDLPLNPVHHFAGALVRRRNFPFLKTELVMKNPERLPEMVNWRLLVPAESPVPIAMIEDHLAAYERPLRRRAPMARLIEAPPPAASPISEVPPAHRYRQDSLRAAWAPRPAAADGNLVPTLDAAMLAARLPKVPCVLSISHDDYAAHCGGVQNVIAAEQRAFAAEGIAYLHVAPASARSGLVAPAPDATYSVRLDGIRLGTVRHGALLEVCRALGAQKAVLAGLVHHLSGHAPEQVHALIEVAQASETLVWLHDFGTLCDMPALLRNNVAFCGAPPAHSAACMVCAHGKERPPHLARIAAFFEALRPVVISPSQSALDFWRAHAPWPTSDRVVMAPARLVPLPTAPPIQRCRQRLRVAHIGVRASHKGWRVFAALAEGLAGEHRYDFLQLGIDAALPPSPAVRGVPVAVGPEHPNAMIDAMLDEEVDVVVNWSQCRETFSFTTHEALAAGAFVVAPASAGNVPEVIADIAPGQGLILADEAELHGLFAGDRLATLLAQAQRTRHVLTLGGASAEWLLARRMDERRCMLYGHG